MSLTLLRGGGGGGVPLSMLVVKNAEGLERVDIELLEVLNEKNHQFLM